MKKEKETKKIIGAHNYLSSPLTKSSSSGMSGTMSAMFEKHLPLRKRGRAGSIGADSTSRKSTPVRPQKGEGAAMLLGMAALLAGQAQEDGKQNGGVVEGSEDGGNSGRGESLPHTTSGAKMLADAEFLVSLTGGGAGTPSGTRTLVQRDI